MPSNKLNNLTNKEWLKFQKSWFLHNPPPRKKGVLVHPAKFPETMAQEFIEFFTRKGEAVLDPMAGTGSTLVAALRSGRNSYGIELNAKYVFSAGVKLNVDEFTYFTLQADHSIQGSFKETIGGALYSYKLGSDPENPAYIIHAGAFLRWKDALIPVIKLDMNSISMAISYDVNVSQLKTASQGKGGFELSLAYVGFVDRKNSSKDRILCPRF